MDKKVQRAALTGGIVWGLAIFITTILSMANGYGDEFLKVMASIYPGLSVSFVGALIGFIYGFLDVFIGVYVVVWIYRKLPK